MKKYIILSLTFTISLLAFSQSYIRKVNRSNNDPEEVTIYINPKNPQQMVAGSNITNVYYSDDGGETWEENTLTSKKWGVYGDPVVFANDSGHFFFCHLSQTKPLMDHNYSWLEYIVVQKSTDGGKTWNEGAGLGFVKGKVQDKEWMSGDFNAQSPYKGNLYISWTEFDKYNSKSESDFSRIKFAYSTNGGNSFSTSTIISDTVGDCADGDHTLEGATSAVLPNGNLLIAWAGHGNIYLDKSTDGGETFGKDKIIAAQAGSWVIPVAEIMRTNGMPFLVSDNSGGAYNGNVYLQFGDDANGDADIFILKSTDGGETWSKKIRINDDTIGNGKDQFLGHIAVDQTNGDIYVVYYSRQNSDNNLFIDTYVAFSTDGGETFARRRITDKPFAAPGEKIFFGDYNGIAAHGGIVRPIWTGITNGELVVKTALLDKKILQTQKFGEAIDYIGIKKKVAEKKVVIHLRLKDKGTFILKIIDAVAGKTFYSKTVPKNTKHELEIKPENVVLPAGKYKIQVRMKGKMLEETFEIK